MRTLLVGVTDLYLPLLGGVIGLYSFFMLSIFLMLLVFVKRGMLFIFAADSVTLGYLLSFVYLDYLVFLPEFLEIFTGLYEISDFLSSSTTLGV